jgi:hypothetical protein
MDLKMEQYERGERFVRAVAEARGRQALTRIWEGPETLPSAIEIGEPNAWIRRVLDGTPAGAGAGTSGTPGTSGPTSDASSSIA